MPSSKENHLENWDGSADEQSIAEGLMYLYNKYIGPGQATVVFTEYIVYVYCPKDSCYDVCQMAYAPAGHREVYGRIRHMGISLEELRTIHRVFEK